MRLIDADYFRAYLSKCFVGSGTHEDDTESMNGFNEAIYYVSNDVLEDMPTVDAVPVVHAHWEERIGEWYTRYLTCSNCGCAEKYLIDHEWEFCPYCGSGMDLKGDE